MKNKLPKHIPVPSPELATCSTGLEIIELCEKYNLLPVGNPKRKEIYEEILNKNFYIRYFD